MTQRWQGLQEPWLGSMCDGFLGIEDTALLPMGYWALREPLRPTGPLGAERWIGVHVPQQQFGHPPPCPALLTLSRGVLHHAPAHRFGGKEY